MSLMKFTGALVALTFIATPVSAHEPDDFMDQSQMKQTVSNHGKMEHSDMNSGAMDHSNMDKMDHGDMDHATMDHSAMDHSNHDMSAVPEKAAPVPIGASTITAKVNGLVCDFCAQALRKVFKKEDAVDDITVDLNSGEVVVALKAGAALDDDRVKKLIRKSGYSLVSIERNAGE